MFFYYVSCESLVPHVAPRVERAGRCLLLGWSWREDTVGFLPPSLRTHPRDLTDYPAATFNIHSASGYLEFVRYLRERTKAFQEKAWGSVDSASGVCAAAFAAFWEALGCASEIWLRHARVELLFFPRVLNLAGEN